jgi:hypothetical protein
VSAQLHGACLGQRRRAGQGGSSQVSGRGGQASLGAGGEGGLRGRRGRRPEGQAGRCVSGQQGTGPQPRAIYRRGSQLRAPAAARCGCEQSRADEEEGCSGREGRHAPVAATADECVRAEFLLLLLLLLRLWAGAYCACGQRGGG